MIKKNILDFFTQVMAVFAYMILVLNIFCILVGDGVKESSSVFALGSSGIPVNITFQFLGVSILIVGIRFLFISDLLIKKMRDWLRILCMLTLIFIVIVVCIVVFRWFPVDQGKTWILFLICYIVSLLGSYCLSMLKIKTENKRLEEALQRLKAQSGKEQTEE